MRIGTWNLAGRWTLEHEAFMTVLDCDVWLLTEVSERTELPGFHGHVTAASIAARRRWAGVFSRERSTSLPDPHPASAMARVGSTTYCSSILPWRSCGNVHPWVGTRHVDKTAHAVDKLIESLPTSGLVWGGDWNHALEGRESAGSIGGREAVLTALQRLGLQVPTAKLAHRIEGLLTIDHIALDGAVVDARRHDAASGSRRLSDHDAYVVETARLSPG